eukprot:gene1199-572_t
MGVSTTSVSTSDFFKKNLVKNLAALLGIDPSKVRVMEVISASGTRRRRATSSLSYVNVQIGDPPQTTTNTSTNQTTNSTSFSELEDLTTKVVQTTQTGSLATATGLDLSLITPQMRMYDALNRWVSQLGRATDRGVTASIVAGTGDPNAQLIATECGSERSANGELATNTGGGDDNGFSRQNSSAMPGNCNDTVVCGNQPILEIRSRFPDALVGNLGWKAMNEGVLFGRESPVSNANDSVIFGHQPEIEVRDAGTNRAAKPLKRSWNVTVTIANNPTGGTLNGTHSVLVHGEIARFTDLSITVMELVTLCVSNQITVIRLAHWTGSLTCRNQLVYSGLYQVWIERTSSYSLNIRASDSAPSPFELTKDVALKVNVLDINDNQPKYDWPVLNITVPEIVLVGQNAFNVTTTDPDEGENGE